MPYEIYQTSAENVIGATDAALQKQEGVDENLVSDFLDTTPAYARDALNMAKELTLLKEAQPGEFFPNAKCALYLCTSVRESKAAILRYMLEQYEPFRTFKTRLEMTGVVGEAATQTKALHNIAAHRQVISSTFIDLGTYAQSLFSEGGGLYRARQDDPRDYLRVLDQAIQDRETAAVSVRKIMGDQAADWVDGPSVFENLITAYQYAGAVSNDTRAPVVHAGNAVESFLSQVANHHGISVQNAHGINAKADRLDQGNQLLSKHKFMVKYLGHVRNAADHGVDAEIGVQWEVAENTAVEYVHVAQSVISAIVKQINGTYVV